VLPGLVLVGALAGTGFLLAAAIPAVSAVIWAMLLGAATAPLFRRAPATTAGVRLAARRLLRIGIALLGLRISIAELAALGAGGAILAAGTVTLTMLGTVLLGRLLGVSRRLTLLIAAGSSICGASAVAAMQTASGADEEDVAYAMATVTLYGTLAMVLIPIVALQILHLSPERAGLWAGASIHEVAQVAGAGAAISLAALKVATLVKLARVVLLAPVIAAVSAAVSGPGRRAGIGVPAFVLAFLAMVLVRSTLPVPDEILTAASLTSTLLLAAALAALGLQIDVGALRRAGLRPLLLGLGASLLATGAALMLVLVTA
jgi:uncharacterized integral membrane protein (TIGR00698 family)